MESLNTLQRQIETSGKLASIVKSLKTLSAVNLRQYEQAAQALDAYQETIESALQGVIRETGLPAAGAVVGGWQGLVIFGSDQGLCGRFNERLVDFMLEKQGFESLRQSRLLVSGVRLGARLAAAGLEPEETFWSPGSLAGVNRHVYEIILLLHRWQQQGCQRVELFFNRYAPGGSGAPVRAPLLPLDNERLRGLGQKAWPGRSLPLSALAPEKIFPALIQQDLFVAIYRAQVQSLASEQASRLYSLQQAEKNIEEHRDELTARYRNLRQSAITAELLDLVAGFRSVTGHPG
ncbi:MAG: F0F1 ATP synthase subunit gamma [Deltaproteobacteria bacterium]|nr:F0F1 ATP synthase subunit gamma [Deltaproteobacteria bacterium]